MPKNALAVKPKPIVKTVSLTVNFTYTEEPPESPDDNVFDIPDVFDFIENITEVLSENNCEDIDVDINY